MYKRPDGRKDGVYVYIPVVPCLKIFLSFGGRDAFCGVRRWMIEIGMREDWCAFLVEEGKNFGPKWNACAGEMTLITIIFKIN